jgi:alpha-L-rhamnosidase
VGKVNFSILIILFLITTFFVKEVIYLKKINSITLSSENNVKVMIGKSSNHKPLSIELTEYAPANITHNGDSCFIEFDKTWFGTLKYTGNYNELNDANLVIGEREFNLSVYKPKWVESRSFGYFKTKVLLDNFHDGLLRLPERTLPGNAWISELNNGFIPFKYVEITDGCFKGVEKYIRQVAITTPALSERATFYSNSEVLNDVYQFTKHTVEATSFAGLFIDGNRELKPYEADSYINQLGYYSVSQSNVLPRATLIYLLSNGTWPIEWAFHLVFMAQADLLRTGDVAFFKLNYQRIKSKVLFDLATDNLLIDPERQTNEILKQNGIKANELKVIIDWPISERVGFSTKTVEKSRLFTHTVKLWRKEVRISLADILGFELASEILNYDLKGHKNKLMAPCEINSVVNAFHYGAINSLKEIALSIGYTDEAKLLEDKMVEFKESFILVFTDKQTGLIIDCLNSSKPSFHGSVLAARFNLLSVSNEKTTLEYIISKLPSGSVYFSQYVLEVLYKYSKYETAFQLMVSKEHRSWSYMMNELESSMATEAWNSKIKENMDYSHAWGTSPLNIINRYLVGIKPLTPGYISFEVAPKLPKEIDQLKVSYPLQDDLVNIDLSLTNSNTTFKLYFSTEKKAVVKIPTRMSCKNIKLNHNGKVRQVNRHKLDYVNVNGLGPGLHSIHISCHR